MKQTLPHFTNNETGPFFIIMTKSITNFVFLIWKATHSSILAWKIPWTEEPGGLQSMALQNSQTRLSKAHIEIKSRRVLTCIRSCVSHVRLFVTTWTVACQAHLARILEILQARILEWVAIPFFRESTQPRDHTYLLHWQADSLPLSHQGSTLSRLSLDMMKLLTTASVQNIDINQSFKFLKN